MRKAAIRQTKTHIHATILETLQLREMRNYGLVELIQLSSSPSLLWISRVERMWVDKNPESTLKRKYLRNISRKVTPYYFSLLPGH